MNLDERLEALVQSVELMAAMHKEQKERTDALVQSVELTAAMQKDSEKRVVLLVDTMNRMGRILELHGVALDDHENRLNDLERPEG